MENDLQNTSTSQGKLVVPFWIYGCCSLSGVVSVVGRRLRAEWPLSSVINRGAMGYNMDKVLPYPSSVKLLQPPYISSTERTTIMDAPLTDAERTALQTSLEALNRQVEATRNILRSNSQKALLQTLHTDQELPDPALEALAGKTINLLHETQQLLEPGHLVLADHFLGRAIPCVGLQRSH